MDRVRNWRATGAGNPPAELADRKSLLDEADAALRRVTLGGPAQGLILVGLRDVGKTPLLGRIRNIAPGAHSWPCSAYISSSAAPVALRGCAPVNAAQTFRISCCRSRIGAVVSPIITAIA